MTFLELCNRVRHETGVTSSGPTSVDNQVGPLERVVSWTKQAVLDVQLENVEWRFLWKNATGNTQVDKKSYTAGDLSIADVKKLEVVLIGTARLHIRDWNWWLSNIRTTGMADNKGQPTNIVIAPNGQIHLYPVPDKVYALEFDYYARPVEVVASTDVPVIPSEYHEAIVQRALVKYSIEEDDGFRYQQSTVEYDGWIDTMGRDQLPAVRFL